MEESAHNSNPVLTLGKYEVIVGPDCLILRRNRRDHFWLAGGIFFALLQFLFMVDEFRLHRPEILVVGGLASLLIGCMIGSVIVWLDSVQTPSWTFDRHKGTISRGRKVLAPLSAVRQVEIHPQVKGRLSFWSVCLVLKEGEPIPIKDLSRIVWRDDAEDLANELAAFLGVRVVLHRSLDEELRLLQLKLRLMPLVTSQTSSRRIEIRERYKSEYSFWHLVLVTDETDTFSITGDKPLRTLDEAEELAEELGAFLDVEVQLRRDCHLT